MVIAGRATARWRAYWRGVLMSAAFSAGQIGPMTDRLAAHREAVAIVRVENEARGLFDPRERLGGLILTRPLEHLDRSTTWEQSGGDLN